MDYQNRSNNIRGTFDCDNEDDDGSLSSSSSSCSDTTLGETSVDLLLGLRRNGMLPPQNNHTKNNTKDTDAMQQCPLELKPQTDVHKQQPNEPSPISTQQMQQNSSPGARTNQEGIHTSHPLVKAGEHSQSKSLFQSHHVVTPRNKALDEVVSPPTQTLNELSQLSGSGSESSSESRSVSRNRNSVGPEDAPADDLMYDMSQLSHISLPAPTDPQPQSQSQSQSQSQTDSTKEKHSRKDSQQTTCNDSDNVDDDNDNNHSENDQSSDLHFVTLPRPVRFGMDVAQSHNKSRTKSYCCVTSVKKGGQADSYGIQKGDLIYHTPSSAEIRKIDENSKTKEDFDIVVNRIKENLKSVSVDEMVNWSKSLVRPVTIVVERLADKTSLSSNMDATSESADASHCPFSGGIIRKALSGRGYPKMPCCRKCNYPSLAIRNHHFLCYKHQDFGHSGAKEKLVILLSGALYGCKACVDEIQTGKKKNSKYLHNFKCQIASKTYVGEDKGESGARGAGESDKKSSSDTAVQKVSGKKSIASNSKGGREMTAMTKRAIGTNSSGKKKPASKAKKPTNKRKVETSKKGLNTKKSKTISKRLFEIDKLCVGVDSTPAKSMRKVTIDQTEKRVNDGEETRDNAIREQLEPRDAQNVSVQVTPAPNEFPAEQLNGHQPLFLTDDRTVSKWVPCANPWGDRAHAEGDFVLFSPDDYQTAFEIYGPHPRRFVTDPFKDASTPYNKSHKSQEEGGFQVLHLSRDHLALRSWGFTISCHDFGGACLVNDVEVMSPADAAILVSSGKRFAPLCPNDMIICINNKNVGGMTEIDFGVELDLSGPTLTLVVSRYKISQNPPFHPWINLDVSESLHWNEIGKEKIDEVNDMEKDDNDNEDKLIEDTTAANSATTLSGQESPQEGCELQSKLTGFENEQSKVKQKNDSSDEYEQDCENGVDNRASETFKQSSLLSKSLPSVLLHGHGEQQIKRVKPFSHNTLKARISSLKIADMPKDIQPIRSSQNKHGYKGVSKHRNKSVGAGFYSEVSISGKKYGLGSFPSIIDAAKMHTWARAIAFGENPQKEDSPMSSDDESSVLFDDTVRLKSTEGFETTQVTMRDKMRLDTMNIPCDIQPIACFTTNSGYKGVSGSSNKWQAEILVDGELYKWCCDSKIKAAKIYAWAYRIAYGGEALRDLQLGFDSGETSDDESADRLSKYRYVPLKEMHVDDTASGCYAARRLEGSASIPGRIDHLNATHENESLLIVQKKVPFLFAKNSPVPVASKFTKQDSLTKYASDEEPEWDDDSNPWLGCVCGETHNSPTPVFWVQCESCDSWYNCAPKCVGFDKKEAEEISGWECPDCAPFDLDTIPKKSTSKDFITPLRNDETSDEEGQTKPCEPIAVGTVVDVEDRMWTGSNKPGGVAKVESYRVASGTVVYDVKYVLENRLETNVESAYVSTNNSMMNGFISPRSTRSAEKKKHSE